MIEFRVVVVDVSLDGSGSVSSTTVPSTFADSTDGDEDSVHRDDSTLEQKEQDSGVGVEEQPSQSPQVSRCPFQKATTSNRGLDEGCRDESKEALSQCPFGNKATSKACPAETEIRTGKKAIRFEIKDYGKGISKKDFESIFQPFHQTRTGKAESVYGGTGLGLAITRKLVVGLRGIISVDSVEGEWAKFTVDLPLIDTPSDTAALSNELEDVTVRLVLGSTHEHERAHALRVLRAFNVDVASFETIEELEASIRQSRQKGGKHCVDLVHEDLLSEKSYSTLASRQNVALVTVGPKYVVHRSDSRHHHLRSLEQMIPCVLVNTIAKISKGKAAAESQVSSDLNSIHTDVDKLRILLAEDNLVNQKIMTRMLSRIGAKNVDVVANGEEAIKSEAAKQYDLILMDMEMPICDGLTATRRICARQGGHPVPKVVFVTAHVSSDFEEECRQAGGSGFLAKPFKVNEIKKCLIDVCDELN